MNPAGVVPLELDVEAVDEVDDVVGAVVVVAAFLLPLLHAATTRRSTTGPISLCLMNGTLVPVAERN